MFRLNNNGFHITFKNGWTVSVRWGPSDMPRAETACWLDDGPTIEVKRHSSPEQVAETISEVSKRVRPVMPGDELWTDTLP